MADVSSAVISLYVVMIRELAVQTPPTPLQESYFSCTSDVKTNLFNAVGISTGTTSLIISAMAVVLMPVIYLIMEVSSGHELLFLLVCVTFMSTVLVMLMIVLEAKRFS